MTNVATGTALLQIHALAGQPRRCLFGAAIANARNQTADIPFTSVVNTRPALAPLIEAEIPAVMKGGRM
jgi:hypothetical protein